MRQAGDGAGKDGPSHGERQHGVDHKHDEQEEGHLQTRRKGVNAHVSTLSLVFGGESADAAASTT